MKTVYTIPAPYSNHVIEVYGDPENGWYEWRVPGTDYDTGRGSGRGYGIPEIALRDALMVLSDLPDPNGA